MDVLDADDVFVGPLAAFRRRERVERDPPGLGKGRGDTDGPGQVQGMKGVKRDRHGRSPGSGVVFHCARDTKSEKRKLEVETKGIRNVAMGRAGVGRLKQKRPAAPADAMLDVE